MKNWFLLAVITFTIMVLIIETKLNADRQNEPSHLSFAVNSIPDCYIPIYKEAAKKYTIPWKLLAAVHRVETTFSTMDPMISHVGAVGHFQFMPRTWVGWRYPGTDLGEISDETDITDINIIAQFGGYGIDASETGKADPFNIVDATYAAAKYLADHGASHNDIDAALFAYNHSQTYVDDVLHFYNHYKENIVIKEMSIECFE